MGVAPSRLLTTPLDTWVHGSLCSLLLMVESSLSRSQVNIDSSGQLLQSILSLTITSVVFSL